MVIVAVLNLKNYDLHGRIVFFQNFFFVKNNYNRGTRSIATWQGRKSEEKRCAIKVMAFCGRWEAVAKMTPSSIVLVREKCL